MNQFLQNGYADAFLVSLLLLFIYWKFRKLFNGIFACMVEDVHLLFTKNGRRVIVAQNHDRHFYVTMLCCSVAFMLLFYRDDFYEAALSDKIWFAAAIAFCGCMVNLSREMYLSWRGGKENDGRTDKVPFDWRDIRFGGYGGVWGAGVALAFILYIN